MPLIDTPNGIIDYRTEGKTDYTCIVELANIIALITGGGVSADTYTDKVLYVAKNGAARSTRLTQLDKPYLTIANALQYAVAGDIISIASGTYAENGLVVPDGVAIKGSSRETVRIGLVGDDVFTLGDSSFLIDLSIFINDGFTSVIGELNGTSGTYNISFYGNGSTGLTATGIGIKADMGTGKFIGSGVRFENGGFKTGVDNASGICTLEDVHVPKSNGSIERVFYGHTSVNGASKMNLSDYHQGNPLVETTLYVGGGTVSSIPTIRIYTPNINGSTYGLQGSGEYEDITIYGGNINFQQYAVFVNNPSATGIEAKYRISANHQPFYFYPPLVAENSDFELNFAQDSTDKNKSAFNVYGAEDFNVGFVERGTEAHIGRGAPYINGMIVLTTDNTATPTTDGSNFIDVTTEAVSTSQSSFSFQGTLSNETILIGTQRIKSDGKYYPFYGIETFVLTGDTTSSYIFEFWNGSIWQELKTLHTPKESGYDYADNLFLWDDLSSLIRFGLNEKTVLGWQDKTINGVSAKWVRLRRTTSGGNIQFENIKLVTSSFNVSPDGLFNKTGLSMSKENITLNGNVWSSAGGGAALSTLNSIVGTGATQYTHVNNQALANSTNDAWYIQIPIKYGQMTALPLEISCFYEIQNAIGNIGVTPNQLKTTVHKILNSGIKVADKTGGTNYELVPRDNADTSDLTTADVYTSITNLLPTGVITGDAYSTIQGKVHYVQLITLTDLQDSYPEDLLVVKIEFENQDGGADVGLWGLILEGVQYQLGSRG